MNIVKEFDLEGRVVCWTCNAAVVMMEQVQEVCPLATFFLCYSRVKFDFVAVSAVKKCHMYFKPFSGISSFY
jgi:hypothetical protein